MRRCLSDPGPLRRAAGCAVLLVLLAEAPAHAQLQGSSSNVGYIDSAIPVDRFRLRYDAANDNNRPDRAEFFYAQYQQQAITGAPGTPLYVGTPTAGPIGGGGGSG